MKDALGYRNRVILLWFLLALALVLALTVAVGLAVAW
jgi:predicted lysophospholipase L1 biosynthesis ABC-type transport system permease subunit